MELETASPELPDRLEELGKASSVSLSECPREHPRWRAPQELKREAYRGMHQHWETQWQEFLKTMQASPMVQENLELAETAPWDDAKGFLTSFEQVAKACQWPRVEWVARLLPALSGKAEQAFRSLEDRDKKDYGKVKAAILREDALRMELQRQHFRQFCCQMSEDPRRIYSQLQELCHRWLKPERRSKEQILELLILEQFLASLPPDLQGWIRAGGPDSCSQAVALAEDFLMSQQEDEREKWQEPEMAKASLDVEGAPTDLAPKRICKEAEQKSTEENNFLGNGHQVTNNSDSLLSPEGRKVAEEDLTEEPVNLKEMGPSLHVVEPVAKQPGQRTMFWQVMQEEDGDTDSLEGLLVPKPDLTLHPAAEEEEEAEEQMFIQFPVESEHLPGQDSGEEKRSRIKMETSQAGEMGTLTGLSQWNIPVTTAVVCEQRCESKGQAGKKPVVGEDEARELLEGFTAARSETSALHSRAEKLFGSKYSRRYPYKPGLVMTYTGQDHSEILMWAGTVHPKMKQTEEKGFECPGCGKYFSQRHNLRRHQRIHTGEKPHICPDCGRSFTRPDGLISHQRKHFHVKPFECPECGKSFSYKCNLAKHQRIHIREVAL